MKEEKNKKSFKERWSDKRERAKIELIAYGIFFLVVVIFVRAFGSTPSKIDSNIDTYNGFITSIEDNYEYNAIIAIDDRIYEYYGKVLGNNSTITLKTNDSEKSYYLMNNKYYLLEGDNYLITSEKEVYPYIDYYYLNIKNIKEYINLSTKENNIYKIKLSDIILNGPSDKYIELTINEGDKNIIINYTPLFQNINNNNSKIVVNITYNNINNIISLEE